MTSIHTWRDLHEQTERERWQRELEHRGGDVEADDGDKRAYHYERVPIGHTEGKADGGGLEYVRPIHGGSLKEAYRLPRNAIRALGGGDLEAGYATSDAMFGHHTALGRGVVHPDVVRHIGDGDLAAGHRVLRKFVSSLKQDQWNRNDLAYRTADVVLAAA